MRALDWEDIWRLAEDSILLHRDDPGGAEARRDTNRDTDFPETALGHVRKRRWKNHTAFALRRSRRDRSMFRRDYVRLPAHAELGPRRLRPGQFLKARQPDSCNRFRNADPLRRHLARV